jgi:hypothetical protein
MLENLNESKNPHTKPNTNRKPSTRKSNCSVH